MEAIQGQVVASIPTRKRTSKGRKRDDTNLYPREQKMLNYITEGTKPNLAAALAYKSPNMRSASATAIGVLRRERFRKAMERAGVTDKLLSTTLVEGLKARKQLIVNKQVQEFPDNATRHTFLKTALTLKGYYPKDSEGEEANHEPLIVQSLNFIGNNTVELGKKKNK